MFEDMMGNMKEQQEAMRVELKNKRIEGEAGDGAVIVICNGLREVINVKIDPDKVDSSDHEALEDMLLVAVNRSLEQAAEIENASAQESLKSMLPPGMGGLGNLFG